MPLGQPRWIITNRQGRFVAALPIKDQETPSDALRRAARMLNRPATDLRIHRNEE
jgi:hypothetical protein